MGPPKVHVMGAWSSEWLTIVEGMDLPEMGPTERSKGLMTGLMLS